MTAAGWTLLGAPWDCSGTGRGEQAAPAALRRAGLSALVGHDAGDVHVMIRSTWRDAGTGVLALADTVRAAGTLADAVTELLKDLPDRRPIVVGGDCSILLGIVPALRGAVGRIGLWYFDGHPDYLDAAASTTGETADMVLAVLAGDGAPSLVTLAGQVPTISMHTVGDGGAVPDQERWYASIVRNPENFRQLYVDRGMHCSLSAAEEITMMRTLFRRIDTGRWPDTSPATLDAAVRALDVENQLVLDFATFTDKAIPPAFTIFVPPRHLRPSR